MNQTTEKSRLKNLYHLWRHRPIQAFVRLGIVSVVLIVALLTVFYFVFRQEIELVFTEWVEDQTHHLFQPEVTFTSMEMSRLGKFTFRDFRIADPFEEDDYFIQSKRVEVQFNPLQLFRHGINLSLVEIHGGNFRIHKQDHQGKVNFTRIFKSTGGKGGLGRRVRVREFILKDCRVRLEDIDEKPIENNFALLEGRFTSISGEHLVEVYRCRVNTSYWSIGPAEFSGIFPIRKGYLGFRRVRVVKGDTDLTGEGFVDFKGRTFEYKIDGGRFDPAHLPPELKIRDRFSGMVGVSLVYQGSFDSTAVQADISLDTGMLFNYPVTDLTTRLGYAGRILRFERLKTDICGGSLETDMEFRFQETDHSYDIKAGVQQVQVELIEIPKIDKLSGRISGQLALRGRGYSRSELEISGTAARLKGELNGVRIDSAGAGFSYRSGKLRMDNLSLHSWESITTAIGDVENNELFLFVNVEKMPARRLRRLLPLTDFSGTIDFSGSLTGSLFDPKLKGTISIHNGAYRALRFAALEGTCELEHLTGTIQGGLQIDLTDAEISGQQFKKLHLNTEIPQRGMTRFSPLILEQDSLNRLYCSGFYINMPEIGEQEIAVDTLEVVYRGVRATSGDIFEIKRRQDTTRVVSLSLSSMGGTISGELELFGTDSVESQVSFAGIDFSQFPRLLGSTQVAGGKLNGKLHVSGKLSAPSCALEADLENARFSIIASEKANARASLDRGMLTIDRLELINPNSTSVVTGRIPLTVFYRADSTEKPQDIHRVEINARLNSFPLSAIKNSLIPMTSGVLQGDLRVTGSTDKPSIEGEIFLEGGAGVIAPLNTRLQEMTGRLEFDTDRIVLTEMQSSSPEGSLQFSGLVTLDGLKPAGLELDITGTDLILQQFKYVTRLTLGTQLKLTGSLPDLLLSGQVRVLEGEVSPSFGQVSIESDEQALLQSALIQIPASPIDYDLHFTAEENFWLRNRNASIKLNANLRAVQLENSPQVTGEITTVTGNYSIYGRRFKIRYGSLQFQGQATINPLLDINAERTVRGKVLRGDLSGTSLISQGTGRTQVTGEQYEIDRNTFYLHIGGTLNEPQFEITVKDIDDREIEPPLTPEQARTLVLVDQTYREFQQQSSLSQAKLLDQAANLALNQANPYIQEFTGFDEFSIESQLFDRTPALTQEDERASAKITLGEFLFETVFFSFSQDLLDSSARSVQIEYLIGRNSSIIGQTDSRGHFSLDFRYLIKY